MSLLEEVARALPQGSTAAAALHLGRLPPRYGECFEPEDIATHLRLLAELGPEAPVRLVVRPAAGGTECTVLAFDHRALFSLICGVLSSLGMDIASGEAFTTSGAGTEAKPRRRPRAPVAGEPAPEPGRRCIIDRFVGIVRTTLDPSRWRQRVEGELDSILRLLEASDERSALTARERVNDMVAAALASFPLGAARGLYPVAIDIDCQSAPVTIIKVVSEDTPFFLYAFSTALALRGLRIEHVRIRTEGRSIRDEFGIVDRNGRQIRDARTLDQVRLSALLTKQFSYFLASAPDPTAALARFDDLVEAFPLGDRERWVGTLSNPRALEKLARLLGASDFLWEDFVRGQYEALLPILAREAEHSSAFDPAGGLEEELRVALEAADGHEGKVEALNRWKDARIFACDLDHILDPSVDHAELGRRLTRLAECVVRAAAGLAQARLARRHGVPRTVAGIAVPWAIMGLGKLGSEALGYASDIELLVVYQDAGVTDGPDPVDNVEYFGLLARDLGATIRSKREGIFSVDLRLRPYGSSGQAAASLESFCRYYGRGGDAHSYERLALVAMRAVAGDPAFGARLERVRDELVYVSGSIDLEELRELRERQVREKDALARANAKFSPGALVDLEYTVQILQVTHGATLPALRTPRIRDALVALAGAGELDRAEAELLVDAYGFLRGLINALRMLRGSALDLTLPVPGTEEYVHLARRMGWPRDRGDKASPPGTPLAELAPERRLHLEFEAQTAEVRSFMQRHFGSRALLTGDAGSMADLVISDSVPDGLGDRVLRNAGFQDVTRARANLRMLAGEGASRQLFARVAVLAADMLPRKPDADMALNNWERLARASTDREAFYSQLLRQPTRLDILLSVFASSQYLSDTLAASPEVFDRIVEPLAAGRVRTRDDVLGDIDALRVDPADRAGRGAALRLVKRRELARIGIKDICLGAGVAEVCFELSELADALVTRALEWVTAGRPLLLLAFGKLGGRELNYSSDVDLVGVWQPENGEAAAPRAELEDLRRELGEVTEAGYVYRVDLRLRPYGASGEMVSSAAALLRYYERSASLWELQAALKARAVAGSGGEEIVASLRRILVGRVKAALALPGGRSAIVQSARRMRALSARSGGRLSRAPEDVKNGAGGIRDVELAVQVTQLLGCASSPELIEGGTLRALQIADRVGVLGSAQAASLGESYVFLRKVEHYLQVFDDRQTHTVPAGGWRLRHLARCLLGPDARAEAFQSRLAEVRRAVSAQTERILAEA